MEFADYVDIAAVGIILLLAMQGLRNGLIHEILSMIGVVLGIYLASKYCVELSRYIQLAGLDFDNKTILWLLAFVLILSGVWIGCLVIAVIIARFVVSIPALALINYCGGYVFALLKYAVIVSVIVYALSHVGFLKEPIANFTENTRSYPIMYEIADKVINTEAIQELQDQLEEQGKKASQEVDKQIEKAKKNIVKSITK